MLTQCETTLTEPVTIMITQVETGMQTGSRPDLLGYQLSAVSYQHGNAPSARSWLLPLTAVSYSVTWLFSTGTVGVTPSGRGTLGDTTFRSRR